jgi:hypothetical protein
MSVASPIADHFSGILNNLSMPKSWIEEGVESPTAECMKHSFFVINRLFETYGILPYKITMSKEGGIFAAYKNPRNKNILRLEVDNELDVVAVVSDGVAISQSGILGGDDRECSIIDAFDRLVELKTSVSGSANSIGIALHEDLCGLHVRNIKWR